jgi:hypothetical protein
LLHLFAMQASNLRRQVSHIHLNNPCKNIFKLSSNFSTYCSCSYHTIFVCILTSNWGLFRRRNFIRSRHEKKFCMFLQCFPQCPKFVLENISILTISMQAQYLENKVSIMALVFTVTWREHIMKSTNHVC